MNFLTCTILIGLIASAAIASPIPDENIENNNQAVAAAEELSLLEHELELENNARHSRNVAYVEPASKTYTYPSPAPHVPCAKNLLFSCSPYVAPVPCAAPSAHYGEQHAGAYSEYIPQYILPGEEYYHN